MKRELLIGCGHRRQKLLERVKGEGWSNLTTLDINPDCKPDVEWDLCRLPLPFDDETFDELHAYDTLEHTGQQGDYRFFLAQFADFWRLLKPGGMLCASVPAPDSAWVWGDPGHTRSLSINSLTYLSQRQYAEQVGKTMLTDYRRFYRADFELSWHEQIDGSLFFCLMAIKPARIFSEEPRHA